MAYDQRHLIQSDDGKGASIGFSCSIAGLGYKKVGREFPPTFFMRLLY